jgi:hypothetical protein
MDIGDLAYSKTAERGGKMSQTYFDLSELQITAI